MQEIIVARAKEDYGAVLAFEGVKYKVGKDGVLDPQPYPRAAEKMLKTKLYAVRGQEDAPLNERKKLDGKAVVKPPSPDQVRRIIGGLEEAQNGGEGRVRTTNANLAKIVSNARTEGADDLSPRKRVQGGPPSPGELRQAFKVAETKPPVPARELGGYDEQGAPVIDLSGEGGFDLDLEPEPIVSAESQAQADILAQFADAAEAAEAIEEGFADDGDGLDSKSISQLRAMAKDKKIPGWAEMSETKLRKAIRRR